MTERILDTDPLGTQENLQRLLEQTRRSRDEIYTPFSMEVMQERDLEDQKYKENYIREQTRLERQRQQTGSGPSSWTAPVAREIGSAIGGSGVALESMGGAIMRGFDPETSDWMVRNTQIYEAARAQGMEEDEELGRTRKEINEMIFSTSNSLAQAGAAGGMAYLTGGSSIGFMAATFAGTQANTSYVTARDHGLSVSDSAKFAGLQGAYEAGFMLMFQALGLGGFEKYITGGSGAFASSTWKELGKVVGLHTLAELEEEELTTLFQTTSRVAALYPHEDAWTGEDGTFLTSEVFRDVVQTAKQTVFMMGVANTPAALKVAVGNSSRSSIKGLPQEAKDRMESEGIDTDKLEGRKDVTTKTLEDYIEAREAKGQLTDDIRFFEQLVKDDSNSDEVREQADHIAISLRGEESTITPNEKIITQLVDKLGISSKPEVSPDIISAPAGSDSVKTSVPQVILKQDPKAEIVDPLDLVSKTPEEDELVRILSVVKELNDSVRGGRRVSIVRTNDPNVRGVYDGDGIYVTEPRLRRYMKDGKLSSEGLRKAVAGTFAHEFDHELKLRNKNAWEELYALLSGDTKYGPILAQKEKDFRDAVEGSSGRKEDPYAAYKGEANKERLDELAKEESLSWLMDDHFITTGLVSKLARNNSTSFEILRDWLRRLRNSLFGDKLYRGMVNVFNKVSTDLDLEPVDVKDVPARKRPARKRPKKSAKKRAKHKASRGLPEWAEGPVDKLEQRGAKVISKDYASETSVVVTVRSKAGAKRIVTLQVEPDPKTKLFTVVNKTSVSATAKNYDDKLAGAIEEATAYDGALIVQKAEDRRKITRERMASTPDPVREYATEMLAQPEDSGISGLTDELNDDLEKLFTGYKEGYKDEETTIEKTSIVPFSKKMESKKRSDSLGPYLTDADVKGMDIKGLISRGMAYKTNDGNYRLTGWGARVAAKEPMDRLGKFDEPEPAPVEPDPVEQVPIETAAGLEGLPREIVELRRYLGKEPPPFDPKFSLAMEDGLTDEEVSRMNTTLERAEFSLKNSKHEGKAQDLVEAVWDGHHTDSVVEWMRENRFKDLQQIIEGVWPSDPETMALHKEFNIDRHLISDLKVRLLMGEAPKRRATKQFGGLGDPHSEWKLVQARSAIPSPMEYRQLRESEVKLSLKYGDLNLPDNYASPKTQKHVDERTRGMVDMVETYGYLRTPKEIRSHIEVEVEGQVRFGEDPEGETDALLKKGADGHIFKDTDMVMISEAHARVLNKLNTTQLTKEERDKLQETGAKLATYEDESGTSWGQAGAFMRHRSESVRVKGQRAFRKALYSNSEKVKRAINRLKGRVLNGDRDAMRKVAALREKWQEELKSIEQKLTDKGWDLDQLDKYLGNSEAVDALVYDIRKLKEPLLTTFVNMQYELFINNILSGPLTQAANLISNAAFAAYEFGPKRIASSLMNEAELLLGLPMGDPLGPRVGELPHLYRHMAIGFYEGMKNFGRSIFYEEETFEKSLGIAKGRMKFGTEGRRKFIGGPGAWRSGGLRGKATAVAGRGVRFAGTTMLTALDVFQKTMNGHAEAAALAYRAAKFQGLKDGEVGQFMDSVMGDKSHPLWMQALETARFLTFQGEPSELAKGLVNIRSRQPGVRWLLPFVITPDNIFRTGVSYSPLGVFSWSEKGLYNSIRKGMKEGDWRGGEGQGVNEKVFQAVVAGSLVALMMGDDDEGMPFITGTNPPQPKFWAQEQRKDAIPAMSVRIGEGYVSYGRAEPFATLLALTKDLALALKTGKNPWSTTKKVSKSMVEVAKDKTYMRTVSDLGYLLSDPERGGIRMAEGFIVAAVPNWWRQGASARREHRPDRRTFWESEEEFEQWQRNMGRRMELPYGSEIFGYEEFPQIDQFGNKVPTGWNPFSGHKSDFWYNLLVPFRGKETHPGMGEKLLRRYNIQNPEKPFGIQKARYYFKVRGERRDLTKQEYREYGELSGEIFKALLDGEAVDVEEPTEAYIRDLWGSNVKLARKAAQKILLNRWAGLHDEAEVSVQEISGEILARNVSKRLTILARRKPRLSSQPPELRRKSMELRKRKLDEDVLVLQNSQKDAISWLATQGYTPEHIKKNIRIRNKGSILRRMKSLGGGAKDEGQRAISPRTGSAGRTARLQTGRLR